MNGAVQARLVQRGDGAVGARAHELLERARAAAPRVAAMRIGERTERIAALRRTVARELDETVAALNSAASKPAVETLLNDVLPTLELCRYLERNAASVLRAERRPRTFLFPESRFRVEYLPRGVALVLAPANLPLQLALGPALTAFAAGNAVVCKVSERVPEVAPLLEGLLARSGFDRDALRIVVGGSELGEALVRARPDVAFLTGGTESGRRVMAAAAEQLTPVVLELGGKDPLVVLADAPFERAVNGAVYGAFANSGQICVAAQRVYVERALFEPFVAAIARKVAALRGDGPDADLSLLASAEHARRFAALVDDAVLHGATLHTPFAVDGRRVTPAVLTGVTHAMRIMREETFGPAIPLMPFDTEDEAVALANDTPYGLGASVWSSDTARGARFGRRLVAGSVAVNDVIKNIGNPYLPFGGVKSSGIGVSHGPEGLRAFCRPLALMVSHRGAATEPNWFPYSAAKRREIETLIAMLYGGGSLLDRLRRFGALRASWRKNEKGEKP